MAPHPCLSRQAPRTDLHRHCKTCWVSSQSQSCAHPSCTCVMSLSVACRLRACSFMSGDDAQLCSASAKTHRRKPTFLVVTGLFYFIFVSITFLLHPFRKYVNVAVYGMRACKCSCTVGGHGILTTSKRATTIGRTSAHIRAVVVLRRCAGVQLELRVWLTCMPLEF